MAPLRGPEAAWHALAEGVRASAERDDFFLRLLAHDCLSRLPPLSFFRDVVIEETGERNEVLHLEQSALRPLVDVGRVFGIASGRPLGGSTLERLERAAAFRPRGAELFREAAETFRVLLFHQSRAGLRRGDAGFEVLPQSLSRHDRRVLKTSFRAIARLLEFTGEGDWLRA
jgi:CBS domain-containing protein